MNKYFRALGCLLTGMAKVVYNKVFHLRTFNASLINQISPSSEITIDFGGKLSLGKKFRLRDNAKLRVRKSAVCKIGNNSSFNSGCCVVCHDKIEIGDNVQFGPNVLVYDHDHDFRAEGGIKAMKYKTSPISIGNGCWIGANTVILRGTQLGENCVVGAGSVLNGVYPDNSVIVQKRETIVKEYRK